MMTFKKYKNRETGEIVNISEKDIDGIYMINPVRVVEEDHSYTECDDLVDENELKQNFEEVKENER